MKPLLALLLAGGAIAGPPDGRRLLRASDPADRVSPETAAAELTGKDGSQVLQLERLDRTEGLDCG